MFAWLAVPPWLRTTLIALVATVALAAVAALGFWRGMALIDGMELRAAREAAEKQDAKWQAQLEKANALVDRERAEQAIKAAALEAAASAAAARAATLESELERKNAELPSDPAGGLSAERNRLLNLIRP